MTTHNDLELLALGFRMDEALAVCRKAIAALPEDMAVKDEFAAIETATAPVEAVVSDILAKTAHTAAGKDVQLSARLWLEH